MTVAEVKKVLSAVRWAQRSVVKATERLERVRAMKTGLKGINYEGGGCHGGEANDISDDVAAILECENKLEAEVVRLARAIANANVIIQSVEDEKLKYLLQRRYFDGLRWEEICVDMKYTWNGMKSMHRRALRAARDGMNAKEQPPAPINM